MDAPEGKKKKPDERFKKKKSYLCKQKPELIATGNKKMQLDVDHRNHGHKWRFSFFASDIYMNSFT